MLLTTVAFLALTGWFIRGHLQGTGIPRSLVALIGQETNQW